MNWIDFIILLPCIYFLIKGIKNGFIVEVAKILGFVLGFWIAIKYSESILQFVMDKYPNLAADAASTTPQIVRALAYLIIILVVILLVRLLARMLDGIVDAISLGGLNNILGAVFGLCKGVVIICIFYYLLNIIGVFDVVIDETTRENSMFLGYVEDITNMMEKFKNTFTKQ